MNLTLHHTSGDFLVDLSQSVDLSTTLEFSGAQPNAFGLPRAESAAVRAGSFVGDTREGGSVNCETVTLNPHGNGTHTECCGHIVVQRIHVSDILQDTFTLAELVSLKAQPIGASGDTYSAPHDPADLIISEHALQTARTTDADSLIVRTLPNPISKKTEEFSGNNPVYLSNEAMIWIRNQGIKHLLVDFPSVDREEDDGELPNHHLFWEIALGTNVLINVPSPNTITEMIYVPNIVQDGLYALSIQIPDFGLDAAPSRPRLFPTSLVKLP